MKIYKIIIGGIFIFSLFFATKVFSISTQEIIINEVMWSGSSSNWRDEWLELRNTRDYEIDITGWEIENLGTSNKSIYIKNDKNTEERFVIPAKGFFLISRYQKNDERSILDIESDFLASVSLSDESNGNLVLKDLEGNIVDIAKGDIWPAGNKNQRYSMERNDDFNDGLLPSSWHTSTQTINFISQRSEKGTPKYANSPPVFTPCTESYPLEVYKYLNINSENCLQADASVLYVVDGDTININLNGDNQRVRLIGIDAPESSKSSSYKINEPYYQEATDFIKEEIDKKNIKILVSSELKYQYDRYDRLLAAIIYEDKIINTLSVENGFSKTYYLSNPLIHQKAWENKQIDAQLNQKGIWNYFNKPLPVIINEFIPNPEGPDKEEEWIELYNPTNRKIDLGNLLLDDEEGGSKPYLIPTGTIIGPYGYLVVKITDSKITLNNNGDSVRLLRPDFSVAEEVRYEKSPKKGWSYNRSEDGSWYWYYEITPGAKNKKPIESFQSNWPKPPAQVENIKQARELKNNSYVLVKGYVTVIPKILSNQYFYIQDDSAAIQIYSYYKLFPEIGLGNYIEVYGQLSGEYYRRIKIKDPSWIRIINIDNKSPPAEKMYIEQINPEIEGTLITITGWVVKLAGQIFYIEDETGQIKITIRNTANFKRQKMSRGDIIQITGIIYCSHAGCSLLPRFEDDIKVLYRQPKKKKSKKTATIAKISKPKKTKSHNLSYTTKKNLEDFLLANALSGKKNINRLELRKKLIFICYYIIIISSVLCIILLGENIWKKKLSLKMLGKPVM